MSTPLEVIQGRKTIEKIKEDVEAEYEMGGLSDGLYGSYAEDVSKRLTLALLQALHDELEGREMEVEVALANPDAMAALRGYNDSIQDQQDNLQTLMTYFGV
jgi:hypothetical protein